MNNTLHIRYSFVRATLLAFGCISAVPVTQANIFSGNSVSVRIEKGETDITVSVKTQKKSAVQFYMFAANGNLIKQMNIEGCSKFSIEHLSKGTYVYDVFNNDERLKSGKIELK